MAIKSIRTQTRPICLRYLKPEPFGNSLSIYKGVWISSSVALKISTQKKPIFHLGLEIWFLKKRHKEFMMILRHFMRIFITELLYYIIHVPQEIFI